MTTVIDRPVFIVGSGRSGTTVFYNLLSGHPDLCWFSNLTDRFPRVPALPLAHRLFDVPGLGDYMRRSVVESRRRFPNIRPVEAERIYHTLCGWDPGRSYAASDRDPATENRLRQQMHKHLLWTGKPRFLSKQTANNQRLALINRLFPEARYVHLIRDGRAVASSLYHVRWWRDITIWWTGGTAADWEADGGEPIELCARQWLRDTEAVQAVGRELGERYLEVRYEDLVNDVPGVLARVMAFAELSDAPAFLRTLPTRLEDRNDAWRWRLSAEQIDTVQRVLAPTLTRLGYDR